MESSPSALLNRISRLFSNHPDFEKNIQGRELRSLGLVEETYQRYGSQLQKALDEEDNNLCYDLLREKGYEIQEVPVFFPFTDALGKEDMIRQDNPVRIGEAKLCM